MTEPRTDPDFPESASDFDPEYPELDALLAARQYSRKQVVEVDEPPVKLVIFQLADSFFALYGHAVKEVLGAGHPVSFIPGMHPAVEGVMNLRGDIESVLSFNHLLQLPQPDGSGHERSSILLCQGAGFTTGMRIDCLHDVTDIAPSQLKPAPESLPDHLRSYVTALLTYNHWTVAVLDFDLLLKGWQEQNQSAS